MAGCIDIFTPHGVLLSLDHLTYMTVVQPAAYICLEVERKIFPKRKISLSGIIFLRKTKRAKL